MKIVGNIALKIVSKIYYLKKKFILFNPNNKYIANFNYMMMLIELFAALLFPMEISFFLRGFKINYLCKLVILLFFILDMLMKFNTVHIDKGI